MVQETALLRLWHKPEISFRVPKMVVYLALDLPEAYTSPEAAVLTRLLTLLVDDHLNEVAYEAEIAGCCYTIRATATGIVLSFAGCVSDPAHTYLYVCVECRRLQLLAATFVSEGSNVII